MKSNKNSKFVMLCWLNLMLGVTGSAGLAWAQTDPYSNTPTYLQTNQAGINARIDVLGESFTQPRAADAGQSRIVIYRLQDGRAGATSVFVDDRYHGSLVSGAWTQLCYRPGSVELSTRQMHASTRPAKDRYDAISVLNLQGGQVHYLRVSKDIRPVLYPVPAAQAIQEMATAREQLHTVSRTARDCLAGVELAAPVAPQTYTLAGDTLFAFDRSDRGGMTDSGTRAIDQLLVRVRSDYSQIDRVHLIGHADPLGRVDRNDRLSVERAQTVRDYMLASGQLQAPLIAEGRGSRELVVGDCGRTGTPQAIACNQSNRRVVVEVTGIRR